nr:VOC family protein [Rhizobiaceae bacterium]
MSDQTQNTCVWFEIPSTDLERSKQFYETVLGTKMTRDDNGPNPMVLFTSMADAGVSGHIYPGEPSGKGCGNTIHLAVSEKLEDAMGKVAQAGGEVVSDIIPIPVG